MCVIVLRLRATLQQVNEPLDEFHFQIEVFVLPVAALTVFVSRATLCGKCLKAWVKNIVDIPRKTLFIADLEADLDALFQHNSILGSVFADFYDQQLSSIQASALSQQVRLKPRSQAFLG